MTLERIDNNKGYSPDNCEWVSRKVQAQNRRTKVNLTLDGETKSVMEWLREKGASPTTFYKKLKKGIPPERAISRKNHRNLTPQHGTNSMYSFYACRCSLCRAAGKEYREQLKLRRQAASEAKCLPCSYDL